MFRKFILLLLLVFFVTCSKDSDNLVEEDLVENSLTDSSSENGDETDSSSETGNETDSSSEAGNKTNFNRESMLTFWADSLIIPSQIKFEKEMQILDESIMEFAKTTNKESLNSVRLNWLKAYKAWQYIEMFNIGKAEEIYYPFRMNIYPVNSARVENNVSKRIENIENPNDYSCQGFPALDYLLFGLNSDQEELLKKYTTVDPSNDNNNYMNYLLIVSNKMLELTNTVVIDWQTYRNTFIASTENTMTSSINKFTNDFIYYYEKGFRANKIGIPAGVFSGGVLPDRAEAYYKKNVSKELSLEALKAITNFFIGKPFGDNNSETGISFKHYIEFFETKKDGISLAELILKQFDLSKESINKLNDDFTIQLDNNKMDMLITYDIIQKAVVFMKVDMLQAININVDYQDADGD